MIIVASVLFARAFEASTNFYVDPDWTGSKSGTQAHPFAILNKPAWQRINSALVNSDVTIYFSALKADGVTQQSRTLFVQCRRTDYTAHRLTLDGYSFYNSNETTPNWLANPDIDINHAYLNGKVFKIVGGDNPIDSTMALGWTRVDVGANDFVTHNGLVYCCIESHLASSASEPGVGANWQLYWDQHGSAGAPEWSSGTAYKCYVKQNNVTIRGFEVTGRRSQVSGDNLIWEYNWIHDVVLIGPGLHLNYTSFPDSPAAQITSRPSTNLIFRNFRIERTYGEGFYLGSINPDAPAAFQLAHGNQHSHILIENFLIADPGVNGGQGDGIDCKNGITYLTIRLGEIRGCHEDGDGINVPMTATNVNENVLIERVFIHDPAREAGMSGQFGIYAATDQSSATSLYGLNGVTIRNNIIANCRRGIQYTGNTSPSQPATNGYIFNNTVYNTNPDSGLGVATNVSNCIVENNFVFGGADPRGQVSSSGVTSDYNAHDGQWTSASEGSHTLALNRNQALESVVNPNSGDFRPRTNSVLKRKAFTIPGFSDDFYQKSRESGNWTIGAVQTSGDGRAAPPGLQGGLMVQ